MIPKLVNSSMKIFIERAKKSNWKADFQRRRKIAALPKKVLLQTMTKKDSMIHSLPPGWRRWASWAWADACTKTRLHLYKRERIICHFTIIRRYNLHSMAASSSVKGTSWWVVQHLDLTGQLSEPYIKTENSLGPLQTELIPSMTFEVHHLALIHTIILINICQEKKRSQDWQYFKISRRSTE